MAKCQSKRESLKAAALEMARRPEVREAAMEGVREFMAGLGRPWPEVKKELGL